MSIYNGKKTFLMHGGPRVNAYFLCQLQYISFNVTSENLVVNQPNAFSRFSTPHHNVLIRLRRNWMLVSLKYSHTRMAKIWMQMLKFLMIILSQRHRDNFSSGKLKTLWARVSFSMIIWLSANWSTRTSEKNMCSSNHFSRKQIKLNM